MNPLVLSLASLAMAVSGFVFGQWVVGRRASPRRWTDADGVPTLEHPARARSGGPCRCEVPYDQYSDDHCARCHGKIPAPEIMTCRCEIPYDRMLNGICSRCMGVIPASLDRSAEWLTDGERGRPADPSPGSETPDARTLLEVEGLSTLSACRVHLAITDRSDIGQGLLLEVGITSHDGDESWGEALRLGDVVEQAVSSLIAGRP